MLLRGMTKATGGMPMAQVVRVLRVLRAWDPLLLVPVVAVPWCYRPRCGHDADMTTDEMLGNAPAWLLEQDDAATVERVQRLVAAILAVHSA